MKFNKEDSYVGFLELKDDWLWGVITPRGEFMPFSSLLDDLNGQYVRISIEYDKEEIGRAHV